MDEKSIESYLNTIKEVVLDEGKLITYTSISKDLCLHVNHCKILLYKFIEQIRKDRPEIELNVSYIISGLLVDNKARTTVALEKERTVVRNDFKIVFYEHVYSVATGPPMIDTVAYLLINRFEDFSLCAGHIKNTDCIKRTSEEISFLKSKSQCSVKPEQPSVSKSSQAVKDNSTSVTKIYEVKSEPIIKTEVPSPNKESTQTNFKQTQESKRNGFKPQKGIAGFFTKSASGPTKKAMNDLTEPKAKDVKIPSGEKSKVEHHKIRAKEVNEKVSVTKPSEINEEKMDVDVDVETANSVKIKTNKEKSKGKSLSQIKKNAKVDKKRKRVLHVSDSESDSEKDPFANEPEVMVENNSDDEIPPTPSINPVKISSDLVHPKKKRKVVDKTYTDEEGYILTKKEVVYESCSENEEEVHAKENTNGLSKQPEKMPKQETSPKDKEKKSGVKNSKKKISPPQKGKQSTLTNFFKKVNE